MADQGASGKFIDLLDIRSKAGHTPFFVAIIRGHLDIAHLLLVDRMSCIDYEDEESDTPLHWAVLLDKPETI
jgi:ankyrin repeat protein